MCVDVCVGGGVKEWVRRLQRKVALCNAQTVADRYKKVISLTTVESLSGLGMSFVWRKCVFISIYLCICLYVICGCGSTDVFIN